LKRSANGGFGANNRAVPGSNPDVRHPKIVATNGRSEDYYPLRLLLGNWLSPIDCKEH